MNEIEAPLTPAQQKLMAYVDDEMSDEERAAFELQLAEDPELASEAAGFQCLADVTKSMNVAEPTDHEMRRFWQSFYNRSEWQIGWIMFLLGLAIIAGWGVFEFLQFESIPAIVKLASIAVILGGGILFWNTLRLKIRTSRFDRYRGVMR